MTSGIFIENGRRCHKHRQFVDVLLRNNADGTYIPFAICWVDGRTFIIDEILEESYAGQKRHGKWTRRYDVRIGERETALYMDHHDDDNFAGDHARTQWWVYAIDYRDRTTTQKE